MNNIIYLFIWETDTYKELTVMRKNKYVLTLDDESYDLIVSAMIRFKNKLIRNGYYTDAVDDALIKFINAKKRYI